MENDLKMSKLGRINEVVALRGVFYKLFETKQREQDNKNEKVLVSMLVPENNFNPFIEYDQEDTANLDESSASLMFASKDKLFDHIRRESSYDGVAQ